MDVETECSTCPMSLQSQCILTSNCKGRVSHLRRKLMNGSIADRRFYTSSEMSLSKTPKVWWVRKTLGIGDYTSGQTNVNQISRIRYKRKCLTFNSTVIIYSASLGLFNTITVWFRSIDGSSIIKNSFEVTLTLSSRWLFSPGSFIHVFSSDLTQNSKFSFSFDYKWSHLIAVSLFKALQHIMGEVKPQAPYFLKTPRARNWVYHS